MDFLLEATQDGSCNQEESFDGKVTTPPSNQPATASAIPSSKAESIYALYSPGRLTPPLICPP